MLRSQMRGTASVEATECTINATRLPSGEIWATGICASGDKQQRRRNRAEEW